MTPLERANLMRTLAQRSQTSSPNTISPWGSEYVTDKQVDKALGKPTGWKKVALDVVGPVGKALAPLMWVGSSIPSTISTEIESIKERGWLGSLNPTNMFEKQADSWEKTKNLYGWGNLLRDHGGKSVNRYKDKWWDPVRAAGFMGDVFLDPVTYLTLGSPQLASKTSRQIAEELTQAALGTSNKATAKILTDASARVSRSHTKIAAGKEALQYLGYDMGLGLMMPGTGRIGRALRFDKALDKMSGGAITRTRIAQSAFPNRAGRFVKDSFKDSPLPSSKNYESFAKMFEQAVRQGAKDGNKILDDFVDEVAPRTRTVDKEATREAMGAASRAGKSFDPVGDIVFKERIDTEAALTWFTDDIIRTGGVGGQPLMLGGRTLQPATLGAAFGKPVVNAKTLRRMAASTRKSRVNVTFNTPRSGMVAEVLGTTVGRTISFVVASDAGRALLRPLNRNHNIATMAKSNNPLVQHVGHVLKRGDTQGFNFANQIGDRGRGLINRLTNIVDANALDPGDVRRAMEEEWFLRDGITVNPHMPESITKEIYDEIIDIFPALKREFERVTGVPIRTDLFNEFYVSRIPSAEGRRMLEALNIKTTADEDEIFKLGERQGAKEAIDPNRKRAAKAAVDQPTKKERTVGGVFRARDLRVGSRVGANPKNILVEPGSPLFFTNRAGKTELITQYAPAVTRQVEMLGERVFNDSPKMIAKYGQWRPIWEEDIFEILKSYTGQLNREAHWAGIEQYFKKQGLALSGDEQYKLSQYRELVKQRDSIIKELDSLTGEARGRLHASRRGVAAAEQMTDPLADDVGGEAVTRARARKLNAAENDEIPVEDMSLDEVAAEASSYRATTDGLSDEIIAVTKNIQDEIAKSAGERVSVRKSLLDYVSELLKLSGQTITARQAIAHLKRVSRRMEQLEAVGAAERATGKMFAEAKPLVRETVKFKNGKISHHQWDTVRGLYKAVKKKNQWTVTGADGFEVRAKNLNEAENLIKEDLARAPLDRATPQGVPRDRLGGFTATQQKRMQKRALEGQVRGRPLEEGEKLRWQSNQIRMETLFSELEESLTFLNNLLKRTPRLLEELAENDETVKALKDLIAGLRGDLMPPDTPASIRSYVNDVNEVRRLEGELNIEELIGGEGVIPIQHLKGDLSEGFFLGPEEVAKFDTELQDLMRVIEDDAVAGTMGRSPEELLLREDVLNAALENYRNARALLAREGQIEATTEVQTIGRHGKLYDPIDPDYVPRRAWLKGDQATVADVPLPAGPRGKKVGRLRPSKLAESDRAARVLSGRSKINPMDATAYDNLNMIQAAVLEGKRLTRELDLVNKEMDSAKDIAESLAVRMPYEGGTLTGYDLLYKTFWDGAQQFGPNTYLPTKAKAVHRALDEIEEIDLAAGAVESARREADIAQLGRFDKDFDPMTNIFKPQTAVGEELRIIMADLVRLSSPGDMNKFLEYYRKLTNFYKAAVISKFGFFERNFMGGVFNNYLADVEFGNTTKFFNMRRAAMEAGWDDAVEEWNRTAVLRGVNPERQKGFSKIKSGDLAARPNELKEDAIIRGSRKLADQGVNGKTWSRYDMELFYDTYHSGVIGSGQAGAEVARGARVGGVGFQRKYGGKAYMNPFRSDFVWYDWVRNRNMEVEELLRGSLAYDSLVKGMSIEDAAARVIRYHFNYSGQAQTSFEAGVRRHVIPFYVWTRNNVPLMVEEMAKNPRKFMNYFRFKQNLELDFHPERNTPEWIPQQMGLGLPIKVKGAQTYAMVDLPFNDLLDVTNALLPESLGGTAEAGEALWKAPMSWVGSQANPIARTPVEMFFGKQFFADLPIKSDYIPMPMPLNTPGIREALAATPFAEKNSKGEYKMQSRYVYLAQNAFPIIGQLRRQFPKEKKYKDRLVSSWTSWMLPVSLRMMTARELNVGKIGREREERELRQLKKSLERQE